MHQQMRERQKVCVCVCARARARISGVLVGGGVPAWGVPCHAVLRAEVRDREWKQPLETLPLCCFAFLVLSFRWVHRIF